MTVGQPFLMLFIKTIMRYLAAPPMKLPVPANNMFFNLELYLSLN
jgi:hypothetical protein